MVITPKQREQDVNQAAASFSDDTGLVVCDTVQALMQHLSDASLSDAVIDVTAIHNRAAIIAVLYLTRWTEHHPTRLITRSDDATRAKATFDELVEYIEAFESLRDVLRVIPAQNRILHPETGTSWQSLSGSGKPSDVR